jgi:hypothetical protein
VQPLQHHHQPSRHHCAVPRRQPLCRYVCRSTGNAARLNSLAENFVCRLKKHPDRRTAEGDKPSKRKPEKHVVSGHGRVLPNDVGLAATCCCRRRGKCYRNIHIQVLLLRANDLGFLARGRGLCRSRRVLSLAHYRMWTRGIPDDDAEEWNSYVRSPGEEKISNWDPIFGGGRSLNHLASGGRLAP